MLVFKTELLKMKKNNLQKIIENIIKVVYGDISDNQKVEIIKSMLESLKIVR